MSPIIEIQRRLVEAGRIRAGEKGDKGEPRKLDKWRLTSKDLQRLKLAASLWGGTPQEWNGRQGEFELYTETNQLPITLIPGQLPTTWYELWSKGGCQRRCDGQHELISDSACLCDDERECKPHTRLSVLLPDLPGIGSWLLSSTGWNAAAELTGAADLLQRASAAGVLIPARLRLEQRVSVQAGQTRRFAVPVIDIDVSFNQLLGQRALPGPSEQTALPQGYTPIERTGNGVSLSQGLAAAESQETVRTARSAAPIPAAQDIPFGDGPVPVPSEDPGAAPSLEAAASETAKGEAAAAPGNSAADMNPTKRQLNTLGALVRELRDEKQLLTTDWLYRQMAENRGVDLLTLRGFIPGEVRDANGVLHFGPLEGTLTRGEASQLIDQLEQFATRAAEESLAKLADEQGVLT